MTCDPDLIACQISRLVDFAYSWDWNAFASTLIATVIGASISLTAVWIGFRLQRRTQYRDRLEECVLDLTILIQDELLRARRREWTWWNFPFPLEGQVLHAKLPPVLRAHILAATRARGQDREVLDAGLDVLLETLAMRVPRHRRLVLTQLWTTLTQWIGEEVPTRQTSAKVVQDLTKIHEEAQGYNSDELEKFGGYGRRVPSRAKILLMWAGRTRWRGGYRRLNGDEDPGYSA